MPGTSDSFSKKASTALQFRSSFAHAMLVQGKSAQCLHLLVSQATHSLVVELKLSCLPFCLAAITAGLNGITMPCITMTPHSHPVAKYCKCSVASCVTAAVQHQI